MSRGQKTTGGGQAADMDWCRSLTVSSSFSPLFLWDLQISIEGKASLSPSPAPLLCSAFAVQFICLFDIYHQDFWTIERPRERSSFAVDSQEHAIISRDCICLSVIINSSH